MRISAYDENATSFLAHKIRQSLNEESYAGAKTANYSSGAVAPGSADRFFGSVAVPGGAVLVPYSSNEVGILGADGSYTSAPSNPGTFRFRGGCLADNGLVIFAPTFNPTIGIYDLKTKQYRAGASVSPGTASGPGFAGCCKLKNGMILLAPRGRLTVGLYNPYTDTYTEGPAHGLEPNAFCGCVPLPDGRALLIPFDGDFFMFYDYKTNTLTQGPASSGTEQYAGAVVLSNGDVVCIPYSKTSMAIYRYESGRIYVKTDPSFVGGKYFIGGALTHDGRVIFAPHNHPNVMYYDPTTDTFSMGTAVSGSTKFSGAVQLPNGKIALAPYTSPNVGIVDVTAGYASSDALRCNMYFNSTL
ncbi:hypothetical protein FY047_12940 [Leclercia adecarboxylata]|uniref:hypothetical protein n=1 Tax=Leclercia adecarboxylata TaxID=83655 RepID=UPI0013DF355C|nr:hypothetical protein [Leclercia adecarboxylata]QIG33546.1 hypothetical protein FY047_12940 [Leclercia adecarboxylata]